MPKLDKGASKEAKSECMDREMGDFKRGGMKSGGSGKRVTNRDQAVAIALSTCGLSKSLKQRSKSRGMSRGKRN